MVGTPRAAATGPVGLSAAGPAGAPAGAAALVLFSWGASPARAGGEKRVPSARSVTDTYPTAIMTGIRARVWSPSERPPHSLEAGDVFVPAREAEQRDVPGGPQVGPQGVPDRRGGHGLRAESGDLDGELPGT